MIQTLQELGLNWTEAQIVNFLSQEGPSTVLQISRGLNIDRSKIYRVIDKLESEGFVVRNPKSKTTLYSALSIQFLEAKIDAFHKRGIRLKKHFQLILPQIQQINAQRAGDITVKSYYGQAEARQLVWNSLASNDVRSFGYRTMREAIGLDFLIRWYEEFHRRNGHCKLLANPETFRMKDGYADASRGKTAIDLDWRGYERRFYETEELPIVNETFLYDDVFAILQWSDTQIFGVEIHNQLIADQQRIVFDRLWEQAKIYHPE